MRICKRMLIVVLAVSFTVSVKQTAFSGIIEDTCKAGGFGDYATAEKRYRQLAEQGNASAQHSLGLMYYYGVCARINYFEALKWYRASALQGIETAQDSLAEMYATGKGAPQNFSEAAKWYKLAARQGNISAQESLGAMYELGRGLNQDLVKAHMWFNLAAMQLGITEKRDRVAARMTSNQISEAQDRATKCYASQYQDCE